MSFLIIRKPASGGGTPGYTDLGAGINALYKNTTANVSYTSVTKPALLANFTDPDFGTVIRRITDVVGQWSGVVSGDQPTVTPVYPTIPAWSWDEAYMILYVRGSALGNYALLNGKTYAFISWLSNLQPNDLEQWIWDSNPATPYYVYFINGTIMQRLDVRSNTTTNLHTFPHRTSWGTDPMYNYWGGLIALRDETTSQAFVFNLAAGTESTRVALGTTGDAPQMLPSGTLVYWSKSETSLGGGSFYSDGYTCDTNMGTQVRFKVNAEEHADNTLDRTTGHDIHISAQYSDENQRDAAGNPYVPTLPNGSIIKEDLVTNVVTTIIGPDNGQPYPPGDTLVSCTAFLNRDWTCVGIEGNRAITPTFLNQEIIIANHMTGDYYRVAHNRTGQGTPPHAGTTFGYWGQPNVCMSPLGTRICFPSDWNGGISIDTYVIELPSYIP